MRAATVFRLVGVAVGLVAAGVNAAKPNVVRVQVLSKVRRGRSSLPAHMYIRSIYGDLFLLHRDETSSQISVSSSNVAWWTAFHGSSKLAIPLF